MRRMLAVALSSVLLVPAARAQQPGMGMGRMGPPPDHWMTLDSLAQAVALTTDQRAKVAPHYAELNAVVKKAADRRIAARQSMGPMGQMTPEQREAMRPKIDSMRAEMEGLQQQVDTHYGAIRALLTADQQAKYDALPKPQVMMRRPPPSD
jgi:phage host-nuclease inhibitor protein Gam